MKAIQSGTVSIFVGLLLSAVGADASQEGYHQSLEEAQKYFETLAKHNGNNGVADFLTTLRTHLQNYDDTPESSYPEEKSPAKRGDDVQRENAEGQHHPAPYLVPFGHDGGRCRNSGDCTMVSRRCIQNLCQYESHSDANTEDDASPLHDPLYIAFVVGMGLISTVMICLTCCWVAGYRGCESGGDGRTGYRVRNINRRCNQLKMAESQINLLQIAQSSDLDKAAECNMTGGLFMEEEVDPVSLASVETSWNSQSTHVSEIYTVNLSDECETDVDSSEDEQEDRRKKVSRRFSDFVNH